MRSKFDKTSLLLTRYLLAWGIIGVGSPLHSASASFSIFNEISRVANGVSACDSHEPNCHPSIGRLKTQTQHVDIQGGNGSANLNQEIRWATFTIHPSNSRRWHALGIDLNLEQLKMESESPTNLPLGVRFGLSADLFELTHLDRQPVHVRLGMGVSRDRLVTDDDFNRPYISMDCTVRVGDRIDAYAGFSYIPHAELIQFENSTFLVPHARIRYLF